MKRFFYDKNLDKLGMSKMIQNRQYNRTTEFMKNQYK